MIRQALIQENGNGRMEPEFQDVMKVLQQREIPVTLFTRKRMDRRQLNLLPDTLLVGEHDVMRMGFKVLGVDPHPQDSYPHCLRPYLHRRTWESTVGRLTNAVYDMEITNPVFVKPQEQAKKFTGFVLSVPGDLYRFGGASQRTPVICSETVNWLSEWRVYVANGKQLGLRPYAGDPDLKPDEKTMAQAIQTLENSEERTAGYGIDFGVLDSGETALVEWNDGFSLGSYNLEPELYTDLIVARWEELMGLRA